MAQDFQFKYFTISQNKSALKVGTDSMLLGALTSAKNPKYALDLGAGTGVLSLMLCQKFPALNMLRQICKCNGLKVYPFVISRGYDKVSGRKIIDRYNLFFID